MWISMKRVLVRVSNRVALVAPVVMGVVGFILVVGQRALDPTNLGWLARSDPAMQYLGWAFFRRAPWTFPLGASPDYGLEAGSAVLYTDSIPLLALLFKPLSPLLPQDFQYFGLWILACFLLQSYFAWRLIGLVTENAWVRLLGSALFVFSPPMLFRLRGHEALIGHWIVLAALLLALSPRRRSHVAWWAALVAGTALIHTYLLAMVLVLWAADWTSNVVFRERDARWMLGEVLLVSCGLALALWQAGFFLVSAGKQAGGYGFYRMNLLSPLDSDGWSRLLKDLPGKEGDYEGFNFLGLGLWLAVVLAIPAFMTLRERGETRFRREWLFLGLALLALFACALSNKVGLGLEGFSYKLPKALGPIAGLMRSSGRMFWPVFYTVALLAVALLVRGYGARTAAFLLAVAVAVQIVDTHPGWSYFRPNVKRAGKEWLTAPLRSPFWAEAARFYKKLRVLPFGNQREHWAALGYYALRHGLSTDVVYLARVDLRAQEELQRKGRETIELARFDRDTLYVLQDATVAQVAPRIDAAADLLTKVDGLWVVAPGWIAEGRIREVDAAPVSAQDPLSPDRVVSFAKDELGILHLGSGWSVPEEWGVWSIARDVTLRLPVDAPGGRLWFRVKPFLPTGAPPLVVSVRVDGIRRTTWRFAGGREDTWRDVEIPHGGAGARTLMVTFSFSATLSPAAAGESGDRRELALGLIGVCAERRGCPRG